MICAGPDAAQTGRMLPYHFGLSGKPGGVCVDLSGMFVGTYRKQ